MRLLAATLTIVFFPHGVTAPSQRWTLRCDPVGGTHPARTIACGELARHRADLAPPTRPCVLMQIRNAPRARVVGTVAGVAVDRLLRPGCDRGWVDLARLLRG